MGDQSSTTSVTRREASLKGERHYFTGRVCKNGHTAVRFVSDSSCVLCGKERGVRTRINHPEKVKMYNDRYVSANYDKIKASQKLRAAEDREHRREVQKAWRQRNRQKVNHAARLRAKEDEARRKSSLKSKTWRKNNEKRAKDIAYAYKARVAATPRGKLNIAVRSSIRRGLKPGGKCGQKTWDLLWYTVEDLKAHLEAQFINGMSWDNYGDWHIDHVVPLKVFNFSTVHDMDFRRAWALKNLQPLWAVDNQRKGDRLSEPFQPSLAFSKA